MPAPSWPEQQWLEHEGRRLLRFAQAAVNPPVGFWWLDDEGRPDPSEPVHTWVSTRMTHVFSLAHLRGDPDSGGPALHGVRSLMGPLRDARHGGWFASVHPDGSSGPVDDSKQAYTHAFVLLAASSACAAGVDGADRLLAEAAELVRTTFLDRTGRVVDSYGRELTDADPYRGANSSMHMVEAMLAAGDVLEDRDWHQRALTVAEHLVHDVARRHGYRLPEHYGSDWTPELEYNAHAREDRFRPYGSTPGHQLEWSRLLLDLEASLADPPAWLLEDAAGLFARAVGTGWAVDGAPGFVYTVDWHDDPVVRARLHWVPAEGIAAAATLAHRTGDAAYGHWYRVWWQYAQEHLLDLDRGSWHHELDPSNEPASTVWSGKPDVYHAYQATLLPLLEPAPAAAVQLRRDRDGLRSGDVRR